MQCCVPFCVNTSDNASTSERTGITFHELPSEGNLRTAWLRALGTQDHHLPDPAVVCSQHFLDDDFCTTESCVRQIHSHAIPSTVQMCMICLDTGSKLSLMSKHKLEEAYEQLTGLSLCRRGNLKQTLCVLCAQRLINFSRFRDLSLRAHSLMTDLVEQHELNTIQHKELMNCTTAHLKCNLTQTTLGANHCDLYIDHTDEEEQTAAEESVVGDVPTVSMKKEESSDPMSSADSMELAQGDHCVSNEQYSNMSIKLEGGPLAEAVSEVLHRRAATSCSAVAEYKAKTENYIKIESVTFGCSLCLQEFVQEIEYKEHMMQHLEVAGGEVACDGPRAAVSRSGDSLVLQNKTGSRRLNDDPLLAADDQASVKLVASNEYEVGAILKSEQIFEIEIDELDNRSSQSDTKPYTDINRFTNSVVQLHDRFKHPNKAVLDKTRLVRTYTAAKPYSCEICNYKCAIKSVLVKHMVTHTGEKPFSCDTCYYKFPRKSSLLRHMKIHTGEKPFSCDTCSYKCAQNSWLLKHKMTHTGEKPFSCEMCNYKCAQKGTLLQHMTIHTGEKPFSCETCGYKCLQRSHLIRHMKFHTGEKPYTCDICNYKCALKGNLLRHNKTHTGEKPFSCTICNYKCAEKKVLLEHIRTHTGERPFSCEKCNYKCAQKSNLVKHNMTHTVEKPFSCEICSYKCALKSHLLQHINTHTGEKSFLCDICNNTFAQKSQLLQHIKTHTGEKPFSCEICNIKFAQKGHLLRHIKTHTGEKPFLCEICSCKYAHKQGLLLHMRTHTGVKPFSCDMCNNKFARIGSLKQHIKIHTGEKTFSCDVCSFKSARKEGLLRHKRSHTGEKPFSCDICNYKFARKSTLLRHKRTHSGEKPFSCELCDYKCTQKGTLLHHIKTHTGEKPFACDICNYKCIQKSALLKHKITHNVK